MKAMINAVMHRLGYVPRNEFDKVANRSIQLMRHSDRLVQIIEENDLAVVIRDRDSVVSPGSYRHMVVLAENVSVSQSQFIDGGILIGPMANGGYYSNLHFLRSTTSIA